jgi:predicted SpoU family rRNA methylase
MEKVVKNWGGPFSFEIGTRLGKKLLNIGKRRAE